MSRRLPSSHLKGLPSPPAGKFWPETVWDLVRAARDGAAEEREIARRELLTAYYKPVYRFFGRVLGAGADRVQDVTQDFFARFIEKDFLKGIRHEKSFQAFLKLACRRHYINWCEAERVRRGGSRAVVPLDESGAPLAAPLAEEAFDGMLDAELRDELLNQALESTRTRLTASGREKAWAVFAAKTAPRDGEAADYASLARRFSISVYDVGNRLAAARKVFREALLDLARRRCGDPSEALAELGLQDWV